MLVEVFLSTYTHTAASFSSVRNSIGSNSPNSELHLYKHILSWVWTQVQNVADEIHVPGGCALYLVWTTGYSQWSRRKRQAYSSMGTLLYATVTCRSSTRLPTRSVCCTQHCEPLPQETSWMRRYIQQSRFPLECRQCLHAVCIGLRFPVPLPSSIHQGWLSEFEWAPLNCDYHALNL